MKKNKKMIKNKKNKNIFGFTLVELLVVISIIGILTMIGAVAFSGAQKKARDTQRKTELDALSKALIMYYNDNGVIPALDIFANPDNVLTGEGSEIVYMAKMPVDPKDTDEFIYAYKYDDDPTSLTYKKKFYLFANLENKSDPQCIGNDYKIAVGGDSFCYGISSPNSAINNWENPE